jgi:thioredoxin 1
VAAQEEQENLEVFEFAVMGMTCGTCANTATELLAKVPGVHTARVDFDSKSGRVTADGSVTVGDVRSALSTYGFEAQFPGDAPTDSAPLPESERKTLDIRTVSHGERVRIEKELAPGKVTIFDYYADWCGPCHLLTPKLERLVKRYRNVALRKVDIVDWESDAAKQASRDFRLSGLPYVRVYGANGEVLGSVVGNHVEQVEELLKGHAQQ